MLRLAWLLLVVGAGLIIGGLLPTGWDSGWAGTLLFLLGGVVVLMTDKRESPDSTDSDFRSALFMSAVLLLLANVVIVLPLILLGTVVVGLIQGFDLGLLGSGMRMVVILNLYLFVSGIPQASRISGRRSASSPDSHVPPR